MRAKPGSDPVPTYDFKKIDKELAKYSSGSGDPELVAALIKDYREFLEEESKLVVDDMLKEEPDLRDLAPGTDVRVVMEPADAMGSGTQAIDSSAPTKKPPTPKPKFARPSRHPGR